VRKAEGSGLTTRIGGLGLLEPFYEVFSRNMRDLGTPVYSMAFFREILATFPDRARVVLVESGSAPAAAGFAPSYEKNRLSASRCLSNRFQTARDNIKVTAIPPAMITTWRWMLEPAITAASLDPIPE
jgi:hypothetical protein